MTTTTTSQQVVGMMAIYDTFSASVRSVGTACTLAGVGVYLHRRQFILGDGKRTLALISQQVTIPLLFFTKIIYCNQNWSDEPCPDITTSLQDVWILLLWPLYVVGIGALVGYAMAVVSKTPMHQRRAVLAACMFGNSTGLPITLLTVVHSNFPSDTDLGRIDPCLFLSVYLLLFPVLQWGIGGWLLAPPSSSDDDSDEKNNKETDEAHPSSTQAASASASGEHQGDYNHHYYTNVLNKPTSKKYEWKHRGMEETDASMYMSVPDHLNRLSFHSYYQGAYTYDTNSSPPTSAESITDHQDAGVPTTTTTTTTTTAIDDNNLSQPPVSNSSNNNMMMLHHTPSSASIGMDISRENSYVQLQQQQQHHQEEPQTQFIGETTKLLTNHHDDNNNHNNNSIMISSSKQQQNYNDVPKQQQQQQQDGRKNDDNVVGTGTIVAKIFKRCLQPPVMGALAGIVVASFPWLRGIFVDLIDRNGSAPMQWMFDALYQVGQAAVPLNMMILGCNLSASYYSNNKNNSTPTKTPSSSSSAELFSLETTLSIVMGKMLIMPMIGFVSAYVFRYGWDTNITTIPEEIAGSFYLVLMIVFLTPTANNVMVMVELSSPSTSSSSSSSLGKKSNKEAIARVIAWQYALSPLLLSVTMTAAVGIAVQWS